MPAQKTWNWQQDDWPKFRYDSTKLAALEAEFLRQSGIFTGAIKHVTDDDRQQLTIELISDEALNTSEIEGEILSRDSLQSSIRRNFGLATDSRKIPPAEQGIAEMMVELYRRFESHSRLNECGFNSNAIEVRIAHAKRNKFWTSYDHSQYLPRRH